MKKETNLPLSAQEYAPSKSESVEQSVGSRKFFSFVAPAIFFLTFLIGWQLAVDTALIPAFILPSPLKIAEIFFRDFSLIADNAPFTFGIAMLGLLISIFIAAVLAVVMDRLVVVRRILYPPILILQVIPFLVFAPIMVLWFGYGIKTQLIMVILICFFPILINLLRGFRSIPPAQISLLRSMGATDFQILYWVQFPNAAFSMWSGLRLTVTYAVTASVISEWIGSVKGLGVVVIAGQKSFAIERVFAVNAAIVFMSLALYGAVVAIEHLCMPWKKFEQQNSLSD